MTVILPRFVVAKTVAGGATAFYWAVPAYWRKPGCPYTAPPPGQSLSQA